MKMAILTRDSPDSLIAKQAMNGRIQGPLIIGRGRKRIEIDDDKIDAIEMQFHAIGEDPKSFLAFVDQMLR